jgi:hypothetical protein
MRREMEGLWVVVETPLLAALREMMKSGIKGVNEEDSPYLTRRKHAEPTECLLRFRISKG